MSITANSLLLPSRNKTCFYIADGLRAFKANPRILLAHYADGKDKKTPAPNLIKNTQTAKDTPCTVLINDLFDKQFPHVESQVTVRTAEVTKQAMCPCWVLPRGFGCVLGKAALVLPSHLTSNVTLGCET